MIIIIIIIMIRFDHHNHQYHHHHQVWRRLHVNIQFCGTPPVSRPPVSSFTGWVLKIYQKRFYNKFCISTLKMEIVNDPFIGPAPKLYVCLKFAPIDRQLWGQGESDHTFSRKLKFLSQFLHDRSETINFMNRLNAGTVVDLVADFDVVIICQDMINVMMWWHFALGCPFPPPINKWFDFVWSSPLGGRGFWIWFKENLIKVKFYKLLPFMLFPSLSCLKILNL